MQGDRTIGVYQLSADDTVKWLCLDIDIDSGETDKESVIMEYTRLLLKSAYQLGFPVLLERSGSKGYHLWTFFDEPIDAQKVMAIGRFIAATVRPPEGLHVEVYPKQASRGSYGNLVKVPLGRHQKTKKWCLFLDPFDFEPLPDQWRALHDVQLNTEDFVDKFIEDNDIDVDAVAVRYDKNREQIEGRFSVPCIENMLNNGVSKGSRDEATFTTACFLRNAGIPIDIAMSIMLEWNRTRNSDPFDDETVEIKVASAYSGNYSHYPCMRETIDPYCETSCRFYANKKKRRGL